ncbi:protein-arginine deiminase family protein [Tenggerimyces flavus]|uniref:Protein-arginine deiminase family protein n=1 Tax=Tenggerimyces flavus TaxID=1708749 RepID=A0ABV7Y287_9ACTN|nr:protein-arginine deiminase family protein [Tenggerimyces flavus]MBM7790918.1 protein-arginine deiminase [Tenggerimyces flavus]
MNRTTTRHRKVWLTRGVVSLALIAGVAGVVPAYADTAPDLRADVNRDGFLSPNDENGEATWTKDRGAIFLPNLDDDQRRCKVAPSDLDEPGLAIDRRLAACNDAADSVVNGRRDAADLAPVRIQPLAAGASLSIDRSDKVRVFVKQGGAFHDTDGTFTARQLRFGVELAVEGRDIIRDAEKWDGVVRLTLTGAGGASDTVAMRVAPLLLQNDLQRATTVFAGKPGPGAGWPATAAEAPWQYDEGRPGEWEPFAAGLRSATKAAGVPAPRFVEGTARWWKDVWWQDTYEPAVATMPAVGGPRTMRVAIRSANRWNLAGSDGVVRPTLRPAGRLLFRDLRGPDVAVVQEFTDEDREPMHDLLNMGGNIESLPPYSHAGKSYPQGRIVYGSGVRKPDHAFVGMLAAQGYQKPVVIDTSWLLVGHADETMHVVPARTKHGWTLMVADPRQAVRLLRSAQAAGAGKARLFEGTNVSDQPTVDSLLADAKFLAENELAAKQIDKQIARILAETGLRRSDLVSVPVPFRQLDFAPVFRAVTPGIPNGLSLTPREFAPPDPHGPRVHGRDVFKVATERALGAHGVRVRWVEDAFWAHLNGGEVHCTTNAWRDVGSIARWWAAR